MKATKKQAANMAAAKRNTLRQLTDYLVKQAQFCKKYDTPNNLLRDYYAEQGHEELKTFNQWKQSGYKVKKGVTALLLWSAPIRNKKSDQETEAPDPETEGLICINDTEAKEKKFYNYISLFSNLQVEKA